MLLPPFDIEVQYLLRPPTTTLRPASMPRALKSPMLHPKMLPLAPGPQGWPGLPMAIQSRYRSQAAALSRAIRMLLMVMLRSGKKGRQGTYRDKAQSNRVMPSPRGTSQPTGRDFTAHLGSWLLWLVAIRQEEAQPSLQPVLERDADGEWFG